MIELIIAFGLDILLGDPVYPGHPIRVIGRWIERTEGWLRSRLSDARLAGLLQTLFIPSLTWVAVWFFTGLAMQIHPLLHRIVEIYFLYSALSVKDLALEARRVYTALRAKKLEAARENLSRIVGRDTAGLSETEVIRATVEAVAESFVDGVLSPLFYAALGGAPLAMAYKAVNTLDSMVGKRTPEYREFGFSAAKLDEIANWAPARISWFLIGLGTYFVNGRGTEAWRVGVEDGMAKSFSNSAFPEAAFAGALGVELGGTNYYGGKEVKTPKLGYPMHPLEESDIRVATRVMKAGSWASLAFALVLRYLVSLVYH